MIFKKKLILVQNLKRTQRFKDTDALLVKLSLQPFVLGYELDDIDVKIIEAKLMITEFNKLRSALQDFNEMNSPKV